MSRPAVPAPRWWQVSEEGEIHPGSVRDSLDGFLASLNSIADLLCWLDTEQVDNGTVNWIGDQIHELASQLDHYVSAAIPYPDAPQPNEGQQP